MILARVLGAVLLAAGLLPIAGWIAGGHEAPWYGDRLAMWLSGGTILLGIAAITFIVVRRRPEAWRDGAWQRLAARWAAAGWRADLGIAAAATVLYAVIAQLVFSGMPLLIDEIVQVWQARVLASGRLWVPTPEAPEFTAVMHLVDLDGRRFSQFPIGGPLMLMFGTLVGAEWLVGPVFAGLAVLCWARLLRGLVPEGVALAAVLVFAMAPFWMFLAGSMMNHVTVTTWLLCAAAALARATRDATARPGWALVAGLALGTAATIRPTDAVAFALPTAAWLLWRARGGVSHVVALLASGVGIAGPLAALLAVNARQTGDPFLFAYVALWGPTQALGFHEVPWGPPHTPLRGLELVNLYLLRLQTYLFEAPAPGLLLATAALLLARGWTALERWAVASSALLLLVYWAYWHDGFYLGPRFLLPLAPWLVLWTVRAPGALAARGVPRAGQAALVTASVAALALGIALLVPIRWQQYRGGMTNVREDVGAALRAAGVRQGTVLVRESWGAELVARMWGLGVDRSDAERWYRTVDGCRLDHAIGTIEASAGSGDALAALLRPSLGDSARLIHVRGVPDTTMRRDPAMPWTDGCVRRALADTAGFALFPPALLARADGVLLVRDLHRPPPHAAGPWWLVRKPVQVGAPLEVLPLDEDSLRQAWGDAR